MLFPYILQNPQSVCFLMESFHEMRVIGHIVSNFLPDVRFGVVFLKKKQEIVFNNRKPVFIQFLDFSVGFPYGVDKRAAVRHQWRVPEADLHTLEFLGGWIGAFIGQKVFHHKTAKKSFQRIYILMIILEILAIWGIYNYLNLGKFNFF